MRGTFAWSLQRRWQQGIIPAYAGNITIVILSAILTKDHPRVCGEHHKFIEDQRVFKGSSPRMRGTLSLSIAEATTPRIIPAYAGNI